MIFPESYAHPICKDDPTQSMDVLHFFLFFIFCISYDDADVMFTAGPCVAQS